MSKPLKPESDFTIFRKKFKILKTYKQFPPLLILLLLKYILILL